MKRNKLTQKSVILKVDEGIPKSPPDGKNLIRTVEWWELE